jgi:hypothetical protein
MYMYTVVPTWRTSTDSLRDLPLYSELPVIARRYITSAIKLQTRAAHAWKRARERRGVSVGVPLRLVIGGKGINNLKLILTTDHNDVPTREGKRAEETATMKHKTTHRRLQEGPGIASPKTALLKRRMNE